jgi:adenylate kinase family enzyme
MADSLRFIFLHGKPAIGKDAQANLLKHSFPKSRKVSGIYRSAIKGEGEFAQFHDEIKPHTLPMGEGVNIPGELVVKMLDSAVQKGIAEGDDTFIFCGILRNTEHLKSVDEWIDRLSQTRNIRTDHISYEASDEVALKRANYRLLKSQLEGTSRPDDSPELIALRVKRFNERVVPLLDQLSLEGRLKKVDGGLATEVLYEKTQEALGLMSINPSPEKNLKKQLI